MFNLRISTRFILPIAAICFGFIGWIASDSDTSSRLNDGFSSVFESVKRSNFALFIAESRQSEVQPLPIRQTVLVNSVQPIAFTDKLVYQQEQQPKLFILAQKKFSVEIYKYANGKNMMIQSFQKSPSKRIDSLLFDTFTGFDQNKFEVFPIEVGKNEGWISITIRQNNYVIDIPIFIEKAPKGNVLFVESTDTLKAYISGSGLRTFYQNLPVNIMGDFTRPKSYPTYYKISQYNQHGNSSKNINCNEHLINADFVLKNELTKLGIPVDSVSDEFFDLNIDLKNFRLIILGAHNEYWTELKIKKIHDFVEQGGSLLILGGNTAYRWIARSDNYDLLWGEAVLKKSKMHKKFLTQIIGSYYDSDGYDTYAPFKYITGAGLLDQEKLIGKVFGDGSNFEKCKDKVKGASGHETDKLYYKSKGFAVLAKGMNKNRGGAEIVYKTFNKTGGQVLNFGSISLYHSFDDKIIKKLVLSFYKNSQD